MGNRKAEGDSFFRLTLTEGYLCIYSYKYLLYPNVSVSLNKNNRKIMFQVKQKFEARKLSGKKKNPGLTQLRDWISRTMARPFVTMGPRPTTSAASSWWRQTTAPAVIRLEWAGISHWLPPSPIFAPASNSGPIRESQICSPNQSHETPGF